MIMIDSLLNFKILFYFFHLLFVFLLFDLFTATSQFGSTLQFWGSVDFTFSLFIWRFCIICDCDCTSYSLENSPIVIMKGLIFEHFRSFKLFIYLSKSTWTKTSSKRNEIDNLQSKDVIFGLIPWCKEVIFDKIMENSS